MNWWPLLGVAIVVAGFAKRWNPVAVVVAAALASGLAAGRSVPDLLALLGESFVSQRALGLIFLTLPVIGVLEWAGLREQARRWIGGFRGLTLARLLVSYLGARQALSMLGLTNIAGQVNVTGILSPGTSIATFASGGLSFADGSTYQYEIDSGVGIGSAADLQIVTGNLDLAGTTTLTLTDIATGSVPVAQGTAFSLLNYTGSWNGGLFTFAGDELANNAYFTAGSNTWEIIYDADSGGANFAGEQVAGSFVNIVAVPEPATAMLGALGGLLALRRRRA